MSSSPLVSVIMIFLNTESFIEEAIRSVLAQTYTHWELLLVDDGSTDCSTEIALRYAQEFPEKVHYLEHEGHQNLGMSATRNLAIRHAKGEYIAFLDADDVWLSHKLEQQVPILNSHPEAGMLFGRTQRWFSWASDRDDHHLDSVKDLPGVPLDTLIEPPLLLSLFLQNERIYPCICSVLVRHQVLREVGGFEASFRNAYEDMVFHSKVFIRFPVYVASECWDRYRQHPESYWKVAASTGQYHPDKPNLLRLSYLEWLEKYLTQQNMKHTKLWKLLQAELWPYRFPKRYQFFKSIRQRLSRMKNLVKLAKQQLTSISF